MRIQNISIENYRSIKKCNVFLNDKLILLGKNNEGKSNVLKAIQLISNIMKHYSIDHPIKVDLRNKLRLNFRAYRAIDFDYLRDMHVSIIQAKRSVKSTKISINIRLDPHETIELNNLFSSTTKSDGNLKVEINFYKDETFQIDVKIKDDGNRVYLNDNIRKTLLYISNNFYVNSIPSIRTSDSAMIIVKELIFQEIADLENNEEYKTSLGEIIRLQEEKMDLISDKIKEKLVRYIPSVQDMKIVSSRQQQRMRAFTNSYDIIIDDGVETKLDDKGDGIISLVAMSLLNISHENSKNSLVLIDEPEAHLHSGAILELKKTLESLDSKSQIIISTHHQLFVDRNNIRQNYFVENGNVNSVNSLREIRKGLGISLSENLINAELIILVEGETDKTILSHLISLASPALSKRFNNNTLVVLSTKGVKNLQSQLMFYSNSICDIRVLVDNDKSSIEISDKLVRQKLLSNHQLFYTTHYEKDESEIEDMLDDEIVNKVIQDYYGIDISVRDVSKAKRFSDRINDVLLTFGKNVSKEDLNTIKTRIANEVRNLNSNILNNYGINVVKTFINSISRD